MTMSKLSVSFKGLELGDKAKKQVSAWKKDKTIKLELTVLTYIERAKAAIKAKNYKKAGGYLNAILKSKKYKDTKSRAKAVKLWDKIEGYI